MSTISPRGFRLELESLLRIPYVDSSFGTDVSPDGKWVAFSFNATGQWEIYLTPFLGSGLPRQISKGPGGKFAPRWSRDGKWLYYAVDLDGSEQFDIFRCDPNGDGAENLTPNTPEVIEPKISLSPDGQQMALVSDRSGQFEAYIVPVSGGEWRRLLELPYPVTGVLWSPDGNWVAVTASAKAEDYYTYIVPLEGGTPVFIGGPDGPISARDVVWSPDSQMMAFSCNTSGFYNIGLFDLHSRHYAWLTSGSGDKEYPDWSPDGKRVAFILGNGAQNSMAVIDLRLRETAICRHEPGVYHRPIFTPDSAALVFVFDNPRLPPHLYKYSLPDGIPLPLTRSVPAETCGNYFVLPEEISYCSLDGEKVPALLFKPPQVDEKTPAVVYIHGGPNWLTMITWDPMIQHMVSRGWVVVAPNYRGSTGYGREWQYKSRFDLGGGEVRDVVAASDYLVQNRLADPECIAVTGRSHGGYLTMCCLTQYPDRWAGGSAVVPFINWFTAHENSREDLQHWDLENFGDPVRDKVRYHERSPFFFLNHILAPVQLICGANDPRCPAEESIQAHKALVDQGKQCDLVLYEGEGHAFLKIENVVDARRRQVEFLAQILEMQEEIRST